jgi:NAD(P)-dependent dehydrogenase (short-subunit alcohol dehydrogenase family)
MSVPRPGSKVVALGERCDQTGDLRTRADRSDRCTFGKVDFLINYAGGALKVAPIEEMDDEINRRIIDLNLTSTIMSCRTFTPQFKQQGFGKIINVSSACDRRSCRGGRSIPRPRPASTRLPSVSIRSCGPTALPLPLLVPGGSNTGFQKAAAGVAKFEWDEELAVRPEHFADMVYQTCALTKGGCVSEMLVYGLAQDVSGF